MKKGITRRVISGLGVAVATILMANSAYALPMLRLTDSGSGATCTLSDNAATAVCANGGIGSGDNSGMAGAVAGTFTLGVWTVNVSTGITKPVLGTAGAPNMDLNTVNNSSGAGTITIEFTDTDFTSLGTSHLVFGGTTRGTVTYSAYASALNTAFAQTTLLATSGPLPGIPYSGNIYGGAPLAVPSSLTQVVTYTHTAAGVSSGDHELIVPDSASAFMLLGLGLVGLAFARWSAL